ncbi:MAG: YggS family pyridoxal phosphate-dependent enzyme [Clostridia bacterium]|nr:YggS family pyridoxal phosphate-dependent enzyme [Clostridia bacterium]
MCYNTNMEFEQIKENISKCLALIEEAKARAGRKDEVTLIGATKTQSRELITYLNDNGLLTDVGENRVQEFVDKYDFGKNLKWHVIGQLQTNKVKYIIDKTVLIHSLDRESLADEIDRQAKKHDLISDCLIEVNMGSEISKGGVAPQGLDSLLAYVESKENIRLRGLMTVMPNLEDKEALKDLYRSFNELYKEFKKKTSDRHKIDTLSCGMTNDYEMAIEYGGATMVRLGRVLFGERNYNLGDK